MTWHTELRGVHEELKREFPKHEDEILDLMAGFEGRVNRKISKWKK